ncbi:MAG: hypothetical protein ACRD16_16865 [Thermoanaerobaculia bacterium]
MKVFWRGEVEENGIDVGFGFSVTIFLSWVVPAIAATQASLLVFGTKNWVSARIHGRIRHEYNAKLENLESILTTQQAVNAAAIGTLTIVG